MSRPIIASFVAEGAGALPAKIDERWKDAAYVFAANLRNSSQFYSLLQAIHKEAPESKRQFSDVYEQVKRFARKPATPDVGELMASIAWVGGEEEEEEEEEPIVESPLVMEDGSTSRTGSANVARYVTLATPSAGAHVALESLRTQLDPYRKRALLSALVPLTQVAAQMVLSAAAGSTTIQEGTLKRVLHRTQKALTPLLAEERPLIPLILACAEFSTPLATSLDVKKDANILALARAANRYEWPDAATLVHHMLEPEALLGPRVAQRITLPGLGTHVEACIVKCI